MECSHAQVVSSVLPNRRTPDRLMGSKAGSTPQGVTTNLQHARETGRFWRGFTFGTLTQGSRIFWPKDEPFVEGSYAVEGRLLW